MKSNTTLWLFFVAVQMVIQAYRSHYPYVSICLHLTIFPYCPILLILISLYPYEMLGIFPSPIEEMPPEHPLGRRLRAAVLKKREFDGWQLRCEPVQFPKRMCNLYLICIYIYNALLYRVEMIIDYRLL